MAHIFPEGRVKETATVTGTNSYSIVGPAGDTFLGFSSEVGDGNTVDYVAINDAETEFELVRGTVNVGAPTTLSRDTIFKSTNAHAAVSWPASTTVTLFSTTRGGVINFGSHDLDGQQLTLSASGTSHVKESGSVANQIEWTIGGALFMRMLLASGIPYCQMVSTDSTAIAGPYMALLRDSTTPAPDDLLGEYQLTGKDSAGNSHTYVALRGLINSPTDGSESGTLEFRLANGSGGIATVGRFNSDHLLIGKITDDSALPGVEIQTNGRGAFTRTDTADGSAILALILSAAASGTFARFFTNTSTLAGQITGVGGVVAYETFTGAHWANWAKEHEPTGYVPTGTVIVSTDELFDQENHQHLCNVAICHERASPRVYGVTLSDDRGNRPDPASLGAARVRVIGRIRGGDLLQASEMPGVAELQPDDVVRSSTIGKVTVGDDRAEERLVPCVLYCG